MSARSIGGYSNATTVDPITTTRRYAASTHGISILQRPNVQVVTGATVQKILFKRREDCDAKAVGIHVIADGQAKTFPVSKEVILAAGVFKTPKILELSGVGQRGRLERLGIPVVVDSPGVEPARPSHDWC